MEKLFCVAKKFLGMIGYAAACAVVIWVALGTSILDGPKQQPKTESTPTQTTATAATTPTPGQALRARVYGNTLYKEKKSLDGNITYVVRGKDTVGTDINGFFYWDGTFAIAVQRADGTIFAYRDENGDGAMDSLSTSDGGSIDTSSMTKEATEKRRGEFASYVSFLAKEADEQSAFPDAPK